MNFNNFVCLIFVPKCANTPKPINTPGDKKYANIVYYSRFLGKLFRTLLKTNLPLIKNVLKPLVKSHLIAIGLTAAASVADTGIHEESFGSGTTTLIIPNKEMKDIMKIVKSLEDSSLLMKGVTPTIEKRNKITKGWISSNVIRYITCKFIRKYVNR